ncbi:hypothetical protein JTB14_025500 [Gonioctena quinquepunctata]|nr:hypothetical protein JTB14_025500 [Gonioctena quinquepunctata]
MEEKESRKSLKKLGGGVNKENNKTTSETQPAENATEELNLCGDEITREEESQIIQKKQRKRKEPKKIMVSSDNRQRLRKDFIQDMQRREESDWEFEKTLGNCNNSDTHHQHTTRKINLQPRRKCCTTLVK